MSVTSVWPRDYVASRERFRELAVACGATVSSHPITAVGPHGEGLTVDTADIRPSRIGHLIIVTGGVHGVEGFVGAAAQTRVLERVRHAGLPQGVGIALVHAVNPWGYAHLRRVDERNVDLNRNFLDPPAEVPDTPDAYAALDPLINPRVAPRGRGDLMFWLRAAGLIARHRGIAPLAGAIAAGQHRFPTGLFHSGTEIGEAGRALQVRLLEWTKGVGRVTHLDVHSGLGRAGHATLIARSNVGPVEGRIARLQAHYRQPVVADDDAGNPYDARGTLARWYHRNLADSPYLYLCVEIGTVNPLRVLTALRRENQAHHWTAAGSPSRSATKAALLRVFVPESGRWRRRCLDEILHCVERTLALPLDAKDSEI